MLRSKNKKNSACGPYLFASLNSWAVTRSRRISKTLRQDHSAFQNGTPFLLQHLWLQKENSSSYCVEHEPDTKEWCDRRVNDIQQCLFQCFALPFRRRGRPWCSRDVSCARLATAPASRSRHNEAVDTDVDVDYRDGCRQRQLWSGADPSFDFGLARAPGQQDCLWPHGRLLRNKRNSDSPRFHARNEGSDEVHFRPSGRHPNVSTS